MQDNENKLMYFGSVDGVLASYPGVLWPRDSVMRVLIGRVRRLPWCCGSGQPLTSVDDDDSLYHSLRFRA